MRKDYDDDWSFEPPPKSLYVWREFSSKKTHKLLERKEREKREKRRERKKSEQFFAKEARKKKNEKKLSLATLSSVKKFLSKERKKRCFSTVKQLS